MNIDLESIRQTANLELLARQLVEGFITGLHKSPYHGFSVEFAEHRLFNAGESTRHIDWKVYARTNRLYTKRYEEETNLRCQLLLDNSSSMYYPQEGKGKITFSILCAASLAYLLQRQRDAVGLSIFSDTLEFSSEVKSTPTHLQKLLAYMQQLLQQQSSGKGTQVAEVIHQIAEKIHKRSLVILFSDMFGQQDALEDIFSALQHLRHNKHEALVFHVTHQPTELQFAFDDRPYRFIDVESQEEVKLNPSQIRSQYNKQMEAYYQELKMRCMQLKVDFVEANIEQDFQKVLSAYLVKRGKMR